MTTFLAIDPGQSGEHYGFIKGVVQAQRDCGMRNAECGAALPKVPSVAHKRNFRPWLATMTAETFFRLLRGEELPPPQDHETTRRQDNSTPHPQPNDSSAPASSALGGPSPAANSFRQFPTGSSPQRGEGDGARGGAGARPQGGGGELLDQSLVTSAATGTDGAHGATRPTKEVSGGAPDTAGETPALLNSILAAACAAAMAKNNKPQKEQNT